MVWTRRSHKRTREEAWRDLFGPEGFAVPAGLAEGQTCELHWHESVLPARVLGCEPPYSFAALLPDLDQALLLVEMEPGGETRHCGIWLSTYGLAAERVRELQAGLDRLAGRALAEA